MPPDTTGLPVVSSREVIARVEILAAARPGGVLAFDADGTLWTGDVGRDMFEATLHGLPLTPRSILALRAEARAHGVSEEGGAVELARSLYDAPRRGLLPQERLCEILGWLCAGHTRDAVRRLARSAAPPDAIAARLRPEVAAIVSWAAAAGIPFYVVSASPRHIVEEAARALPSRPAAIIATTPAYQGESMLPEVARPCPFGRGKVEGLRSATDAPVYAAFGDGVSDLELLQEAAVPVAVAPHPELSRRAAALTGFVELRLSEERDPP
jgi:phosphatidylglycerophosphatase C